MNPIVTRVRKQIDDANVRARTESRYEALGLNKGNPMTHDEELPTRLIAHANLHKQLTSPYDDEQLSWEQDLRDAAAEIIRLRKAVLPEDD